MSSMISHILLIWYDLQQAPGIVYRSLFSALRFFIKVHGCMKVIFFKIIINNCFLISCFKQQNVKIKLARAFKVRFY